MKYYLQLLTTDSGDTTPAVVLHFDSQRYLFNCGEGTQRFCQEHTVRLAKVRNIFLTRVAWNCVGGLPGMMLTLADAGTKSLKIHGPNNLTHFLAATRHFVYRRALSVDTHEFHREGGEYQDENLVIRPVLLFPDWAPPQPAPDSSRTSSKRGSPEGEGGEHARKLIARMFPSSAEASVKASSAPESAPIASDVFFMSRGEIGRLGGEALPETVNTGVSLCYICKGPEAPGKFDPVAAKALGVTPGVDFGRLTRRESITTPGGTVVHPDQCIGKARPGAVFLIVDCPSPAYIPAMLASESFAPLFENAGGQVACIVHMCGPGVLEDPRYAEWACKSSPSRSTPTSPKSNCLQVNIDHYRWIRSAKLFYFSPRPRRRPAVPNIPKKFALAQPLLSFQLEPSLKLDSSECPKPFDSKRCERKIQSFLAVAGPIKDQIAKGAADRMQDVVDDDVVVVPLGTGSAIPGKYRNVSSTYVSLPRGSLLFDAGEGTLGQLLRHFGPTGTQAVLASLKLICVSHLHADHHLGVVRVLKAWRDVRADRQIIHLVGPARFAVWLREYAGCEDFGLEHVRFIDCAEFLWCGENCKEDNERFQSLDLSSFSAVQVFHCPWAYAFVLETNCKQKVVFSGDCRPSKDLQIAGRGATILIHEATLEDDMQAEAIEKRHCTTSEALEVARGMEAKTVLLTHFSQRYPKVPTLPAQSDAMPIGVAFDLMRLKVSEAWRLPKIAEGLHAMFNDRSAAVESEAGK
ncbi:beta-lactamase-like protein [Blyttiomyces helicus]|uniref:ribonuclease Z n=1 Tax=Blyttiomyces helicus TaxID=388810 RepID=A0A4P9WRA5_9FUNG|nr:beta-lactamase-like protein [Blyttiomyces helicus]|eukprot:RKO93416.1 beta-lactamase-like protein [Blyttiomyces helicus]